MTLQQLRYIVSLENSRHFVKAAKNCYVNQSTLTIQVKKLEEEIGILIFDRGQKPLGVTPAGESIILKARMILNEVDELKSLVSNEKESLEGKFRLGVIPTVSPYIIPQFSGRFSSNYKFSKLVIEEWETEYIVDHLKKGKLDIGIAVTPIDDREIREIKLYDEPFVFYAQSENILIKKGLIEKTDLNKLEDLWLLKEGHCFKNQVMNLCDHQPSDRRIEFQSGSIETLKKMVINYGGYTLIPELSVSALDENYISYFKSPQPVREVSLIVHKSFSKEHLLEVIRKEILTCIPKDYKKNQRYIRVKWK